MKCGCVPGSLLLLAALAGCAYGQPAISANGVVNAASFAGPQISGASPVIAQGGIFTIFGTGLGPTTPVIASSLPLGIRLPDNANGISVKVNSGLSSVDAFIVSGISTQVSAILPSITPVGAAMITVTYNGQTSTPQKVTVAQSSFGIFTLNQSGAGPAVVQEFANAGSLPLNQLSTAAQPNQTLILYGTGLGPISGPDNAAPGVATAGNNVQVLVGGQAVTPTYAGRAPQFPGEDQINFVLPPNTATGCYVSIAVATGTTVSPEATVSIANGNPNCAPPFGLTQAQERTLDSGGKIRLGVILLARLTVGGLGTGDGAAAAFLTLDSTSSFNLAQAVPAPTPPVPLGTCVASATGKTTPPTSIPSSLLPTIAAANLLDAGTSLTLNGPGVGRLMSQDAGVYLTPAGLTKFFTPGTWTVIGGGGADVGAFTASLALPALVSWTNPPAASTPAPDVSRSGITFTWTGGGNDYVLLSGYSANVDSINPQNTQAAQFMCAAAGSAGTFTVPASIAAQFPAAPSGSLAGYSGTLSIVQEGGNPFTAPKLDAGFISYTSSETRAVTFR